VSQKTVRAAIQAYLQAQNFANVEGVYRGIPTFVQSVAWGLTPGVPWTAVICVNLDRYDETRISLSAPNPYISGQPVGQKARVYDVSIVVQQQYSVSGDTHPDDYTDAIDTLLAEIVSAVEADPTLGTRGTPIWQAGQEDAGLGVEMDVPQFTDEGTALFAWNRVTFKLTEIVTA
jgi:hypothetical protein